MNQMTAQALSPTLSDRELELINAYWRAANYLSVGQIYLLDNPLLREPLAPEHIKPRLLGHWGTTPGLNLIYAHLNRVIRHRDLNIIYITGPGHGGPGLVANPISGGPPDQSAVTRAGDVDDVEIAMADDAVEMGVDEVEARCGAPVSEQARLDVFWRQRFAQQRVVQQVDLAHGQVIGGRPVGIDEFEFAVGQRRERAWAVIWFIIVSTGEQRVGPLYPNRGTSSTSLAIVLGFAVPQFGESAHLDVGELARFASTAEQLGADSLWVGDRLLAAVHPTVGYAGTDTIPEQFRTSLDPFIALTVAATVTTKARLGSSVFVAPWYPPAQLGRQLPSIDVISGGRLLPGFGIGWSPEEYRAQAPRSSVVARNWMNCWTRSMHCGRRTPLSTPARAGRSPSRGWSSNRCRGRARRIPGRIHSRG